MTADQANVKSVASLLHYVRFDKEEKKKYLDVFQANKNKYNHWCLDYHARSVTFMLSDEKGNTMNRLVDVSVSSNNDSLINTMLAELPNPGKAAAVFQLIYKHVKKRVSLDDFTISLKSAKTGKKTVISLVEYLENLTTEGRPVDPVMLHLHKYLSKFVLIPSCFVLNASFRR